MNGIDGAIAAAGKPPGVEMAQMQRTIASTGRPFMLAVPADLTDEEALAICGFVTSLPVSLRQRGQSRIILPRPIS